VCTRGSNWALLGGPSTSPLDAVETPWWESSGRIVWWIFSRLWAAFMAIGWPALALYGALQPHPSDLEALHLGRGEAAILIGSAQTRRSYIVVPRDLPRAAVSQVEEAAGTFAVINLPGQGLLVLIVWVSCLYATWYFWIKPQRAGI
jgi:hypothetical protein